MIASRPVATLYTSGRLASGARSAAKGSPTGAGPGDTYGPWRPGSPEGIGQKPALTQGKTEVLGYAGLGLMAGGLLGAAILGGKWAPALAMVAFLTGEALIMLAVKEM